MAQLNDGRVVASSRVPSLQWFHKQSSNPNPTPTHPIQKKQENPLNISLETGVPGPGALLAKFPLLDLTNLHNIIRNQILHIPLQLPQLLFMLSLNLLHLPLQIVLVVGLQETKHRFYLLL